MNPTKLDHVAYWVAERDPIADFLTSHLGMHVIDRTERFTLLGSDARRGKLTLFAADGPRDLGALKHVALRVSDLDAALAALPDGLDLERPLASAAYFDVGAEGVRLGLVEAETDVDYDLDHVALLSRTPEETAGEYTTLGFALAARGASGAPRVEVGGAFVEFHPGSRERPSGRCSTTLRFSSSQPTTTSPPPMTSARSKISSMRRIRTQCSGRARPHRVRRAQADVLAQQLLIAGAGMARLVCCAAHVSRACAAADRRDSQVDRCCSRVRRLASRRMGGSAPSARRAIRPAATIWGGSTKRSTG
jgi:catechol 2,3-dioxygenase-like lactoylglutathione lyase family enzyme